MEEIYTNIYKDSRKRAGLEQSEAADMIGVSYHSLAKYEKKINASIPPDDVVRNMVIAYNDRNLAYKHIKASPLGEFLPDFSTGKSLTVATLSFLSDFKAIEGILNTKEKDVVLDLFGGSGTSIIACEQNGRICFTMELDPRYVDVIIDRWEKLTGEKAVLLNRESEAPDEA